MIISEASGLQTVPYGLIHLASGELAYITKRIDRDDKGNKFAMEDMCQLTGRLTEDKFKGSHEKIAKTIKKFSTYFSLSNLLFIHAIAEPVLKYFSKAIAVSSS
ncbi:MAG: HipA domain-containing protein [Balneolaceae bacterium]|nr:HipA domain-containing protein [Balneolaceae bacterium]